MMEVSTIPGKIKELSKASLMCPEGKEYKALTTLGLYINAY
jgi:hypothetical protein